MPKKGLGKGLGALIKGGERQTLSSRQVIKSGDDHETYRKALRSSMKDGRLDDDGDGKLRDLRYSLGITDQDHDKYVSMVLEELENESEERRRAEEDKDGPDGDGRSNRTEEWKSAQKAVQDELMGIAKSDREVKKKAPKDARYVATVEYLRRMRMAIKSAKKQGLDTHKAEQMFLKAKPAFAARDYDRVERIIDDTKALLEQAAKPASGPEEDEGSKDNASVVNRHFKKGVQYFKLKKYALAIEEWEKVQKLEPDNKTIRKGIAHARARLEQEAKAADTTSDTEAAEPPSKKRRVIRRPAGSRTMEDFHEAEEEAAPEMTEEPDKEIPEPAVELEEEPVPETEVVEEPEPELTREEEEAEEELAPETEVVEEPEPELTRDEEEVEEEPVPEPEVVEEPEPELTRDEEEVEEEPVPEPEVEEEPETARPKLEDVKVSMGDLKAMAMEDDPRPAPEVAAPVVEEPIPETEMQQALEEDADTVPVEEVEPEIEAAVEVEPEVEKTPEQEAVPEPEMEVTSELDQAEAVPVEETADPEEIPQEPTTPPPTHIEPEVPVKPDKSAEADGIYQRAIEMGNQGRFGEALSLIQQVLALQPDHVDALNDQGVLQFNLGNVSMAVESYEKALDLQNDAQEIWINLGVAQKALGRKDEALHCYDKALELSESDDALSNKGVLLFTMDRFKEAEECFSRATSLNADNIEAWLNRGMVLEKLDKPQEALNCYDKVLQKVPGQPDALRGREECRKEIKRNLMREWL